MIGEWLEAMPELAADERAIESSRWFDAPREMVWEAFANPKQVVEWWGPHGFTMTIREMDVRPGGMWVHTLHGPDGTDFPGESTFTEVIPGKHVKLALKGGREGEPEIHFTIAITWTDEAGGTRIDWRIEFPSREERDEYVRSYGAVQGLRDLFVRLETLLAKQR